MNKYEPLDGWSNPYTNPIKPHKTNTSTKKKIHLFANKQI